MSLVSPDDVALRMFGAAGVSSPTINRLLAPFWLPIAFVEMYASESCTAIPLPW
jgi:hypothetical protein